MLGALLSVSVSSPAWAYRTAGEEAEFEGTLRVRWASDKVSFVLNSSGEPSSVGGSVSAALLDAMSVWNEPPCSGLEFQPVGASSQLPTPGDGVNTVAWVRDWDARGFGEDAPATTDVQYGREILTDDAGNEKQGGWQIVEADVYLDARRRWILVPGSGVEEPEESNEHPEEDVSEETFDLLSVLTHELGHAAGLMHPCEVGGKGGAPICSTGSSYAELTMYPFYAPDQATLEMDDERGLCFLYEQDTCDQNGCDTGYKCVDQRCEALCGSMVCGAGESCVDSECIAECTSIECLNPACKRNKDCPATLRCENEHCVPGLSELGDPCATPRDCASQACSKAGVCLPSCTENADCADSGKCRAGMDGSRVCATSLNALGEGCEESNECLGEQCIADALDTPICTRRCGEGEPSCPLEWTCEDVETRSVCVPPAQAPSCALGRTPLSRTAVPLLELVALVGLLGRRRRR